MKNILKITVLLTLVLGTFIGYKYARKHFYIGSGGVQKYDRAEIYIQAGHEGRTRGSTGTSGPYGNEIDWTPIVADEATRILEEAGISVIRSKADRKKYSIVDLALSIHFDGCVKECGSGASIGYDDLTDKPAADEWKSLYSNHFKHKWHEDNFTKNLSNYYNFKYTITRAVSYTHLTLPTTPYV